MIKEVPSFLFHCEIEKKLTQKTLKAYSSDLKQFEAFLIKYKIEFIDKEHLKHYFLVLSKYAPRTIKRKIATLKTFFSYLEFEEIIENNPFRKIRGSVKLEKTLPTILSVEEIVSILKVAYRTRDIITQQSSYSYREKVRNIAVVELLLASGIRVSELCSLRVYNMTSDFTSLKIQGKGSKERMIPITNSATQNSLKENYRYFRKEIEATSFVFVNRFGNALSEQSVRYIVKKYAKKAKIRKNVTPHVFRHSFATLLLEGDVDIRYIQHLLGHSSINVTQIYTHVNEKKKKEILTLNSPRNLMMI
ncbi:MAG: tyrosine-type recombinase/integrase [Flavobacteriaceae bacterium]